MINLGRTTLLSVILAQFLFPQCGLALPRRLIVFLDGVAYRDMVALQKGTMGRDGRFRQCFRGYFPASRVISTYPSASDVASTDIFGNRPLPGYQRTYYSYAANTTMFVNPVTSAMEFERQMTWRMTGGFRHAMSFVAPLRAFKWEVPELVRSFLASTNESETFYAYICSTDNAQHLARDIMQVLCGLDAQLEQLRATYRAREGRELEVIIFSDHGNNHTPGQRVKIRSFLQRAGYRISTSIKDPKDVVLPTAGIESWVELHNAPSQTESLLTLLTELEGVDVLTAKAPGNSTRFVVMNSRRERALIDWDPAKNSFRYEPEVGDPINYAPVVDTLRSAHMLDERGFGGADAWLRATTEHHYPVALERIVRGHTRVTLNPATIILSLDSHYVHSDFWIKTGSGLVSCAGTHGGLNDLDSNGVLLSSFGPATDTTTYRLAGLYDGFKGLRDYRTEENGAELISPKGQALIAIPRARLDRNYTLLNPEGVYIRAWSPLFAKLGREVPLDAQVEPARDTRPIHIRRSDPIPPRLQKRLPLGSPISFPEESAYERVYSFPDTPMLDPGKAYRLSGRLGPQRNLIFDFEFRTDAHGQPVAF